MRAGVAEAAQEPHPVAHADRVEEEHAGGVDHDLLGGDVGDQRVEVRGLVDAAGQRDPTARGVAVDLDLELAARELRHGMPP